MAYGLFNVPFPQNEPILSYGPSSKEKQEIKAKLAELKKQEIEIPIIIGGQKIKTGDMAECVCPHDHGHVLARYHKASEKEVAMAVEAAMQARKK
ncbi:MAG: 1-pyrroline-5-carboxylate dehydrogenase, partial [bacterium]